MTAFKQLVLFHLDSETKGAVKYREILSGGQLAQYPNSPGASIGVLYIRKGCFRSENYPTKLNVEISEVSD